MLAAAQREGKAPLSPLFAVRRPCRLRASTHCGSSAGLRLALHPCPRLDPAVRCRWKAGVHDEHVCAHLWLQAGKKPTAAQRIGLQK